MTPSGCYDSEILHHDARNGSIRHGHGGHHKGGVSQRQEKPAGRDQRRSAPADHVASSSSSEGEPGHISQVFTKCKATLFYVFFLVILPVLILMLFF